MRHFLAAGWIEDMDIDYSAGRCIPNASRVGIPVYILYWREISLSQRRSALSLRFDLSKGEK